MTPEEHEAVRRALAATPPVGPMPPDVVARMEATIAGLAATRSAQAAQADLAERPAEVVDLEERRRRRWPRVLVAAASVAVVAYGVGTVLPGLEPQAETAATDSAGGAAVDEGLNQSKGGAEVAPEDSSPGVAAAPELLGDGEVVELRSASLRRDVAGYLRQGFAAGGLSDRDSGRRYPREDGTCVLPDLRESDEVVAAARLDSRPATLVVREDAGKRVASVYWCGDGRTLLARTELPARR